MNKMFSNWLALNEPSSKKSGDGHKYYRTAIAIRDRFQKAMQKADQKLREFDCKARKSDQVVIDSESLNLINN